MEWINEKAKTLKQGAIRAMFDRANTMTGVISLGIGEPDMSTPKPNARRGRFSYMPGYPPINAKTVPPI